MEGTSNTGASEFGAQRDDGSSGVVDSLRNAASTVVEKGHDALASVKEKAADLPGEIADKLDAGADAIRPEHMASTPSGMGGLVHNTKIANATDKLADGMESGADWLRNTDLNKMRDNIEQQVRDKPAQSLLIALGIGYMLGKAIRR